MYSCSSHIWTLSCQMIFLYMYFLVTTDFLRTMVVYNAKKAKTWSNSQLPGPNNSHDQPTIANDRQSLTHFDITCSIPVSFLRNSFAQALPDMTHTPPLPGKVDPQITPIVDETEHSEGEWDF